MAQPKTVFLTGVTGFIGKHICLELLREGYRVRGSLRSMDRRSEVTEALRPHLTQPDVLDSHLAFVKLDLLRDDGWREALEGADVLVHTASPFPMAQPDDEDAVVRPAVEGTLRALRAARATGVDRVILTSSAVAVMETDLPAGRTLYDENDWSDTDAPSISPYAKSKTLAERAAWTFVEDEAPEMQLTVINPGLVLGPPLDEHFGTSIQVVERIVRSNDPAVPNIGFMVVDVRDVAALHVQAIELPETVGERYLGVSGFMWMPEMAQVIAEAFPDRRIVTRRAPNWLIRILALFDKAVKGIVPALGVRREASNRKAARVFQMQFFDPETAVREAADFLIRREPA